MPKKDLVDFALHLGDNCLILGQRVSEWCGHAPVLEEDIALANTALDLIGQARLWLGLAGEWEGNGRSADDLAFFRDSREFRNFLLLEQPNCDFGVTLMRQLLFDLWQFHLLQALVNSKERRFADIASKAIKEVAYHLRRSQSLVVRLGDGSEESHDRMQTAADKLWLYTEELFLASEEEKALAGEGLIPDVSELRGGWSKDIEGIFAEATLRLPQPEQMRSGGKEGLHSEQHGYILAEMQFLQRAYPGCNW